MPPPDYRLPVSQYASLRESHEKKFKIASIAGVYRYAKHIPVPLHTVPISTSVPVIKLKK